MATNKDYEAEKLIVGTVLRAALEGNQSQLENAIKNNRSAVLQYADANGRNSLHFAAYGGHTDLCQFILGCLENDTARMNALDLADSDNHTVLKLAIQSRSVKTVTILFDIAKSLGCKCVNDDGLLHTASKLGDADMVLTLLKDCGLTGSVNSKQSVGTPMFWCAFDNNVKIAQILVEYGADVNITDNEGVSPLFIAVTGGAEEMILFLLNHGASIYVETTKDGKTTVFHTAAGAGLVGPVHILLEHCEAAKEALQFKSRGMTPVEFAAFSGHRSLVEAFVHFEGGSEIELEDLMTRMTKMRHESEKKFADEYTSGLAALAESKEAGNKAFLTGDVAYAIESYSKAIDVAEHLLKKLEILRHGNTQEDTDKIAKVREDFLAALLCNRSACNLKLEKFEDAREDAHNATLMHPKWPKGYYRLGLALSNLKEHADAAQAFWTGYELAPQSTGASTMLELFKKEVAIGKALAQQNNKN